jgi:hypothetical protein
VLRDAYGVDEDEKKACTECYETHMKNKTDWPNYGNHRKGHSNSKNWTFEETLGPGFKLPKVEIKDGSRTIKKATVFTNPHCCKDAPQTLKYSYQNSVEGQVSVTASSGDSQGATVGAEVGGKVWDLVEVKINTSFNISEHEGIVFAKSWEESKVELKEVTNCFDLEPDTWVSIAIKMKTKYVELDDVEYWEDEIICKHVDKPFLGEEVVTRESTKCGGGVVDVFASRDIEQFPEVKKERIGNCSEQDVLDCIKALPPIPVGGTPDPSSDEEDDRECGIKCDGRWIEKLDGMVIKDDPTCSDSDNAITGVGGGELRSVLE